MGREPEESEPTGIRTGAVSDWLAAEVPGAQPPFTFDLIAGGRSNLTFRVTGANGTDYALRRPPTGHVLPTAHDMVREHRVMAALGPTGVPVPRMLGLCLDDDVNGAPFFVMEFVEGHVLRNAETATAALGEPLRRRAGLSVADTLAELHAVDVDAAGLADFARREDYIGRQLRRWHGQFERSAVPGEEPPQIVNEVHDRLALQVPEQRGASVVHGDYRLDNLVLGDDGRVRAVLDWEICTLGAPLADLGLLMVYWTESGEEASLNGVDATTVAGFPSRAEVRDRYALTSGRDVTELDFYVAFGYWKLACILQGVHARYARGFAAGDRSNVEAFAGTVMRLAEAALDALRARPR